ncbi:hypothetical protein Hdeb2414_s0010g00357931 [Helianthus debilis subsp. tardiflorus]
MGWWSIGKGKTFKHIGRGRSWVQGPTDNTSKKFGVQKKKKKKKKQEIIDWTSPFSLLPLSSVSHHRSSLLSLLTASMAAPP